MNVGFEAGANYSAWIAISCPAIEREVLRSNLQNRAIFLQPNFRCEFYCIVQITRIDLARPAKLIKAAAVHAFNRCAANTDNSTLDGYLRLSLGFRYGGPNRVRCSHLIGYPAL